MSDHQSTERNDWMRSVVARFEAGLLRYAIHITGDGERGRDVVQDTFLRLCREDRSRTDGHLAEWLFTVCRNRALDVRRKEKRMTTIADKQVNRQESREPPQAVAAENREAAEHVFRALDQLSENQQEVVRLKFLGNLSYKEISNVTDLSVSNVGYLLHTAIQRLRKELQVDCS